MDEVLKGILAMLAEQGAASPQEQTWAQRRAAFETSGLAMALPEEPHDFDSKSLGGIACLRVTPKNPIVGKALLYFHGGGYSVGSSLSHRHLLARIAVDCGITVWSVDYRLAPENSYPAAVIDARAAFKGLLKSTGIDPSNVVLAGDSAGGGLVQALVLSLRDKGVALPAGCALFSPWVDMTASGLSYLSRAEKDPMLSKGQMIDLASLYVDPSQVTEPLASPLFADMAGFPALYIQVGDSEVLLDDSAELVVNARRHGVIANIDVYPDMFHVFQYFWPMLPQARDALKKYASEVRKMLSVPA